MAYRIPELSKVIVEKRVASSSPSSLALACASKRDGDQDWIVQLGEGVGIFFGHDEEQKTVREAWIFWNFLGRR